MKIAIIGAGAMGCLFGGLLSDACEVCLYSRNKDYMGAIAKNGLLMTRDEERMLKHPRAVSDPAEIGPADVAILFTKATGVRGAMQNAMISCITKDTTVLALQNGIGAVDIVKEFLPEEQIAYGFSTLTSDMVEPGHVEISGKTKVQTCFAPLNGKPNPTLEKVAQMMQEVGLNGSIPENLDETIWYKLLVNTSHNTICSLLRTTVSGLNDTPESNAIQTAVVLEVAAVARAKGLNISDEQALAHVAKISAANPNHVPSMVFDVLKKKPTEIMNLNGAVVKVGKELGVPTPVNELLTNLILALEKTTDKRVELEG